MTQHILVLLDESDSAEETLDMAIDQYSDDS